VTGLASGGVLDVQDAVGVAQLVGQGAVGAGDRIVALLAVVAGGVGRRRRQAVATAAGALTPVDHVPARRRVESAAQGGPVAVRVLAGEGAPIPGGRRVLVAGQRPEGHLGRQRAVEVPRILITLGHQVALTAGDRTPQTLSQEVGLMGADVGGGGVAGAIQGPGRGGVGVAAVAGAATVREGRRGVFGGLLARAQRRHQNNHPKSAYPPHVP
jgi:hypothetical protein